jgi:AcrR family transcriptional regulator
MTRDAQATKQRIFAAASAEFARHGLAGARVDAIAERAGANKQLIYAYFGSKEDLFATVLGRQLEALHEGIPIDAAALAEWAGALFDFHADQPELNRLLLYEALHYGADPVPEEQRRRALNVAKVEAVQAGQAQGTIDPSLDPRDLVLLVIGLAAWAHAAPQLTRMVEGVDACGSEARARRRASVVEAVRRIASPR